jgi:hypothetical protein
MAQSIQGLWDRYFQSNCAEDDARIAIIETLEKFFAENNAVFFDQVLLRIKTASRVSISNPFPSPIVGGDPNTQPREPRIQNAAERNTGRRLC